MAVDEQQLHPITVAEARNLAQPSRLYFGDRKPDLTLLSLGAIRG